VNELFFNGAKKQLKEFLISVSQQPPVGIDGVKDLYQRITGKAYDKIVVDSSREQENQKLAERLGVEKSGGMFGNGQHLELVEVPTTDVGMAAGYDQRILQASRDCCGDGKGN
jgi:hypothetical protein